MLLPGANVCVPPARFTLLAEPPVRNCPVWVPSPRSSIDPTVTSPKSLRGKNEDRSIFGGQNNSIRRMAGYGNDGDARPLLPTEAQTQANANNSFGGPHTGICQFVFCDGSVKALNLSVSLQTLTDLVTRANGRAVSGEY